MQQTIWVVASVACVLIMPCLTAQAQQEDSFRLLNGALIGPTTAYVPLDPEFVCGQVAQIVPSPTATDAIIMYTAISPARSIGALVDNEKRQSEQMGGGQAVATNLVLWSADHTVSTVWRGSASLANGYNSPMSVEWLPDTRIAIAQIMSMAGPITKELLRSDKLTYTISYLRINGATGKTQTLLTNMDKEARLLVAPGHPVAVVMAGDGKSFRRIDQNGIFPPTAVSGTLAQEGSPYWYGWLGDGKTIRGMLVQTTEDGKQKRASILLDTTTGTLTEAPAGKPVLAPAVPPATSAVPFAVQRGRETLTREGIKTNVHPLWLEGRDKEITGRTLIAADSDPDKKPVVLQTGVLYQNKGAVYAVPFLKADVAEFLAQRRIAQKTEAMKRAKQIGLAMMMYAADYEENFPAPGSDMSKVIGPYLKNGIVFNNPATGQSGFTAVYKTTNLSEYESPASTPLGHLDGPGGRAIIFADGHVKWEDTPPNL